MGKLGEPESFGFEKLLAEAKKSARLEGEKTQLDHRFNAVAEEFANWQVRYSEKLDALSHAVAKTSAAEASVELLERRLAELLTERETLNVSAARADALRERCEHLETRLATACKERQEARDQAAEHRENLDRAARRLQSLEHQIRSLKENSTNAWICGLVGTGFFGVATNFASTGTSDFAALLYVISVAFFGLARRLGKV